jgi:hypothetical protein
VDFLCRDYRTIFELLSGWILVGIMKIYSILFDFLRSCLPQRIWIFLESELGPSLEKKGEDMVKM